MTKRKVTGTQLIATITCTNGRKIDINDTIKGYLELHQIWDYLTSRAKECGETMKEMLIKTHAPVWS